MTRPHAGGPGSSTPSRLPISPIGSLQSDSGSGITSLGPFAASALGDLMVFAFFSAGGLTSPLSVEGGGVASGGWTQQVYEHSAPVNGCLEVWTGVVSSLGSSSIITTGVYAPYVWLMAQEFTTGDPTCKWYAYGNAVASMSFTSTTFSYPSACLTPQGIAEMYLTVIGSAEGTITVSCSPYPQTAEYNGGTYPNRMALAWFTTAGMGASYSFQVTPAIDDIYITSASMIYATT